MAKGFGKTTSLLQESDLVALQKVGASLRETSMGADVLDHLRGRLLLSDYHVVLQMLRRSYLHPLDTSEEA